MNIRDLHNEFRANRRTAERAHYGKILTVSGISVRTGESVYGTPVVEVSDTPGGPQIATFVFPFDHRIKDSFRLVRSIPLGVTVTVEGECRVFSEDGTVLVFKGCKLFEP